MAWVEPSVEDRLFKDGFDFHFFQAVRVLQRLRPNAVPVGRGGPPKEEVVRFKAHVSTAFPPSMIYDVARPGGSTPLPVMTVSFFGVTGPSGVLPRHYTELLLKIARESRGTEKYALRDWYDLFNHRLISLYYRAWEKYRFPMAYERGEGRRTHPDAFTRCLLSLVGIEPPTLRNRLQLVERKEHAYRDDPGVKIASIDDLNLFYYSGFLSNRNRNVVSLEAMLSDYFSVPVEVRQFQGRWLLLEPSNQSALGDSGHNNRLGVNLVAGERVWDVQGKIRIRIGAVSFARFLDFVPNRADARRHNSYFHVVQLVRFYVGPDVDFDVQVVLRKEEVPMCRMTDDETNGPLLGWNTWIHSGTFERDPDDAVFEGREIYELVV